MTTSATTTSATSRHINSINDATTPWTTTRQPMKTLPSPSMSRNDSDVDQDMLAIQSLAWLLMARS